MRIAEDVTALVGNTPLVRIPPPCRSPARRLTASAAGQVVAKLEFYSPAHTRHANARLVELGRRAPARPARGTAGLRTRINLRLYVDLCAYGVICRNAKSRGSDDSRPAARRCLDDGHSPKYSNNLPV
jgi:hypothetical protein